jgi:hypothetical protein
MASQWNMFVKKIFEEGVKKHGKGNYSFKQALKDASSRKGEMGSSPKSSTKKVRKSRKSKKGGKKSRKNRKH